MPTPTKGPRLGGTPAHERLILANLAQSLFEHGKITTTVAKAKRLRPLAEKLITAAKRGTLHSRRQVLKSIRDKDVVHRLFAEIGPSFATREGGYTRITKTMPRKGDNAPMAVIELIGEETVSAAASRTARAAASRKKAAETAAGAAAASATETPAATEVDEASEAAESSEAASADDVVSADGSAEGAASDAEAVDAAAAEVSDEPEGAAQVATTVAEDAAEAQAATAGDAEETDK